MFVNYDILLYSLSGSCWLFFYSVKTSQELHNTTVNMLYASSGNKHSAYFCSLLKQKEYRRPPTFLHSTQRTAVTPCGPNDAPHNKQCDWPSPHAVFLILSRRLERRLRTHANKCDHRKLGTGLTPKTIRASEEQFPILLNPLLLHGLHHGSTSQHTVDDLLLLIRELLRWEAARHVHRPPNPEHKNRFTQVNA